MSNKLTEELKIKIRDEFVHGSVGENGSRVFLTIDKLHKKYDVSRATLFRYSSEENWQSQKNKIQSEIQQALDDDRVLRIINDSKKLDDTAIRIAQALLNSVGKKLQASQVAEQNKTQLGLLTISELRDASHIAQNAQKLGKLALGEAQEITKVSADVNNPESFRRVMEQLDELAESRSQRDSDFIH
tara:strand:+ start:354 stop:914 length:561 start_codon:yes stop_codon:yes gene_type:complete